MNFGTKPLFFADQSDFRSWLEKNHNKETELFVGFYKVASGEPSMTWSQSVDQALCFGWIDAVSKSIDDKSYMIRFTRRKTTSIWSNVNIKKIEELTAMGLMRPAGMEASATGQKVNRGFMLLRKRKSGFRKNLRTNSERTKRYGLGLRKCLHLIESPQPTGLWRQNRKRRAKAASKN